jgi:hypothetical protein
VLVPSLSDRLVGSVRVGVAWHRREISCAFHVAWSRDSEIDAIVELPEMSFAGDCHEPLQGAL